MKGLPCKSHGETVKTVLVSLVVYDHRAEARCE
jgi:hypothetical protein